jgi:hypothetical protein
MEQKYRAVSEFIELVAAVDADRSSQPEVTCDSGRAVDEPEASDRGHIPKARWHTSTRRSAPQFGKVLT